MMMTTTAFYDSAIRLVESGRLAESVLDGAVRNILRVKVGMGLFERPLDRAEKSLLGAAAHRESALFAARESVTLLKNDGMLPLDKSIKRIAVIGANADDIRAQYGDWTYFTHPHPNPKSTPARPYVTLLEGVRALAKERGIDVVFARGCGPLPDETDDLDAAVFRGAGRGRDRIRRGRRDRTGGRISRPRGSFAFRRAGGVVFAPACVEKTHRFRLDRDQAAVRFARCGGVRRLHCRVQRRYVRRTGRLPRRSLARSIPTENCRSHFRATADRFPSTTTACPVGTGEDMSTCRKRRCSPLARDYPIRSLSFPACASNGKPCA